MVFTLLEEGPERFMNDPCECPERSVAELPEELLLSALPLLRPEPAGIRQSPRLVWRAQSPHPTQATLYSSQEGPQVALFVRLFKTRLNVLGLP